MRSVAIDMTSVRFCTPEMLDHYRTIDLIRDYVDQTERRVEEYNAAHGIGSGERRINGLHQTNLGVFRAYLVRYLRNEVPVKQGYDADGAAVAAHRNGTSDAGSISLPIRSCGWITRGFSRMSSIMCWP